MSRPARSCRVLAASLLLGQMILEGSPASATLAPAIRHSPIGGVPRNGFAQVEATVESTTPLRSAKLYFRAAQYEDFYYVEMERDRDDFIGILPIPAADTPAVDYFIEVVDQSFETMRTEVQRAVTTDDPVEAAVAVGLEPKLTVGKLTASAPDLPPGFQAVGIAGFIGVAGVGLTGAAAGGTGAGLGTAVLVGAAGAGAIGAAAVVGSGDSGNGTMEVSLHACFTIEPAVIEAGEAVRLDGRCSEPSDAVTSYAWDLGDGRAREGPSINPIYTAPGLYTITLRIAGAPTAGVDEIQRSLEVRPAGSTTIPGTGTTTSIAGASLTACIQTTPDPPNVEQHQSLMLDGRCSTGDIATFEWDLGDGRPRRSGAFITVTYPEVGAFVVTLTVSNATASATTDRTIQVSEEICICHVQSTFQFLAGARPRPPFGKSSARTAIAQTTTSIITTTLPPTTSTTTVPVVTETTVCGAVAVSQHASHPADYPGTCDGRSLPLRSPTKSPFVPPPQALRTTTVVPASPPGPVGLETSFISFIEGGEPGAVRARVRIGDPPSELSITGAQTRHGFRAGSEEPIVEGSLIAGDGELRWIFDFVNAPHFVPGSLEVELGRVLIVEPRSIVFHLSGHRGEQIRFRYRLGPAP